MSRVSPALTIVIKLGTSSICDEETSLPLLSNLSLMVETIVKLRNLGHRVILVTSGAIGVGLRRLNMNKKPKKLAAIQAVAAVGQGRLMRMYDDLFSQLNQPIAQILLTRHDLSDEIKFGDNDTLSAVTAGMVNADYLFLMTDVDCLYTDNPRTNPNAKPVEIVEDVGALRDRVSSPGSTLGTGGMFTKLIAADLATAAGVTTIISRGSNPQNILSIIDYLSSASKDLLPSSPPLHTRFLAKDNPMVDRKWWILHGLHTAGTIHIDEGAMRAITKVGLKSSLFAAGIVKVEGTFVAHQAVNLTIERVRKDGKGEMETVVVGKGLVNYSSTEIFRIKGCKSFEIEERLGYADSECVIHRDNLVITIKNVEDS
ncbi:4018_t:CDS:2 [Acaulospora colombiana]|uniref:4018_t:CDS:1 n=1 Tax=Acaulospora colombiana TaxID=27376 RepID=A0ACA9JX18_9GLOM|nr:4018_t:CDS:2 [Acaulospora colombiana]